jgi:drug/metabolite transporter (DMT)-like permease
MTAPGARVDSHNPGERKWSISAGLPELSQFAVVLMWASTFILTKDAFADILPLAYASVRFIFVAVLAFGVLAIRGSRGDRSRYWHLDRADLPRFAVAGLFGYTVYQVGFTLGLSRTSPFASALLIAMLPLFSLLIVTLRGERSPTVVWIGVGVAVAGVAIFLGGQADGGSWLGNVLSLMAALSFALYGIVNRPLVRKYPAETVAAYTTLFGTIPLIVLSIPQSIEQDWGSIPLDTWLVILYMAVLPVYAAYMMWNWAIRQRGVTATSWTLLVPVVSGVFSAALYGEEFGWAKLLGGALAIAGLVLMRPRPPAVPGRS